MVRVKLDVNGLYLGGEGGILLPWFCLWRVDYVMVKMLENGLCLGFN